MWLEALALFSLAGFAGSNALETALLTLSLSQEKQLARQLAQGEMTRRWGRWYQKAIDSWKRHPLPFLMAILVFNAAFSMLWCLAGLNHLGYGAASALIVGVVLFLGGELVPKVWARRFPQSVLVLLLLPFYFLFSSTQRLLAPLARYFERVTHWHLPPWLHYPMTETQIKRLLADAELTQDLRPRSRLILETMLGFSTRLVRQAMIPASEVYFVQKDTSAKEMVDKILESGYSRVPVSTDGTFQGIIGVLYVKDLIFTYATSGLVRLQDILRSCPVVEEGQNLMPLLSMFRKEGVHIALVKNRDAKFTGIISLEDILEELVGEIQDEFDWSKISKPPGA